MKWVIALVVVVALGWFGMQYMKNNAALDAQNLATEAAEQAEQAAEAAKATASEALAKAQESMPEGVDLGKINDNLSGVFSSAGEAFGGITDVESATAAIPSLEDASSKLSGISDVIGRLPDAAKGPIAGIISGGLATLQPIIEQATAIPGVGPVIEPIVTPMMEMLEGLAG
ncbi:MAG: hypothetical protein AB8B97_07750 [Granulosicoccus sp.]